MRPTSGLSCTPHRLLCFQQPQVDTCTDPLASCSSLSVSQLTCISPPAINNSESIFEIRYNFFLPATFLFQSQMHSTELIRKEAAPRRHLLRRTTRQRAYGLSEVWNLQTLGDQLAYREGARKALRGDVGVSHGRAGETERGGIESNESAARSQCTNQGYVAFREVTKKPVRNKDA
jgi:hypothetical protein